MGRRCKTLLPIANSLLKPRYDTEVETQALAGMKQPQKFYYNKGAKPLEAILPGETVRMKLPGRDTWCPGTCISRLAAWSYMVKVDDTEYRHMMWPSPRQWQRTLLRILSPRKLKHLPWSSTTKAREDLAVADGLPPGTRTMQWHELIWPTVESQLQKTLFVYLTLIRC